MTGRGTEDNTLKKSIVQKGYPFVRKKDRKPMRWGGVKPKTMIAKDESGMVTPQLGWCGWYVGGMMSPERCRHLSRISPTPEIRPVSPWADQIVPEQDLKEMKRSLLGVM